LAFDFNKKKSSDLHCTQQVFVVAVEQMHTVKLRPFNIETGCK